MFQVLAAIIILLTTVVGVQASESGLNNQVQHLSGRVLRWEPTTSI
jgi:hypothetical protein